MQRLNKRLITCMLICIMIKSSELGLVSNLEPQYKILVVSDIVEVYIKESSFEY